MCHHCQGTVSGDWPWRWACGWRVSRRTWWGRAGDRRQHVYTSRHPSCCSRGCCTPSPSPGAPRSTSGAAPWDRSPPRSRTFPPTHLPVYPAAAALWPGLKQSHCVNGRHFFNPTCGGVQYQSEHQIPKREDWGSNPFAAVSKQFWPLHTASVHSAVSISTWQLWTCAVIAACLNASPWSQVGVVISRSVKGWNVKCFGWS